MLVKFDSKVGEFTMLGDDAKALLKMLGHSGTIPGAILAEDVPAALQRLEAALKATAAPVADTRTDDEEDEEPVSVQQRAYPLLELLRNAADRHCNVMWDRSSGGI